MIVSVFTTISNNIVTLPNEVCVWTKMVFFFPHWQHCKAKQKSLTLMLSKIGKDYRTNIISFGYANHYYMIYSINLVWFAHVLVLPQAPPSRISVVLVMDTKNKM